MRMSKKSSPLLKDEQIFIHEIETLLATWGLAPSSGRVYGYLLLHAVPMTLDEIAADLEMSRAGAWNAARVLERFGHVRRYGTPGSKLSRYAMSDNFAAPVVAQASLLENFEKLLRSYNATGEVAVQLEERAQFLGLLRNAIRAVVEEWGERRMAAPRRDKRIG